MGDIEGEKEEEVALVCRLREILRECDLNTTSAGAVRRQLESDLSLDLSNRKKFISQLIDRIINEQQQQQDEPTANKDEDEDEDIIKKEQDADDDDDDDEAANNNNNSLSPETPTPAPKKRKPTGFAKLSSLSPQLQALLHVPHMSRTQVVKQLWVYIREKDLQDPSNRQFINCDDMLRSIFRVDRISMFQMNKLLSKHIWPLDIDMDNPPPPPPPPTHDAIDSSLTSPSPPHPQKKKQKRHKKEEEEEDTHTDVGRKTKQQKGKSTSGFLAPLQLSNAFANFLATGETTLSRSEAVKRIWGYIKLNDLQDPSDKRRILCDEKLKELFEVDTFNGFSVTKFLSAHLSKVEK